MFHLVSQLSSSSLIASAIGFVAGGLLSFWFSRRAGNELRENWRAKLLNANRKVDILRWELKAEEAKAAEIERAHAAAAGELQSALTEKESALQELTRELRQAMAETENRHREAAQELERQKAEAACWYQKFKEMEESRDALNRELDVALSGKSAALAKLSADLQQQKVDAERWRQKYTELEAQASSPSPSESAGLGRLSGRIAELEQSLGSSTNGIASQSEGSYAELIEIIAAKDAEIERLRKQLTFSAAPLAPNTNGINGDAAKLDRDDLKLIFGIGPALEKRLNRAGIYTFRQIADWTAEDIARLDEQMPGFSARVQRDRWMASAREQNAKKYGELRSGASA